MKVLKLGKKKTKINRKQITQCGESIYYFPEVKSVKIEVALKDGCTISFERNEREDSWLALEEEIEAEEKG
tara:strand:- start:291 stop:503 length:213 start_codon:yes stop_codon:yes gene_type:complete